MTINQTQVTHDKVNYKDTFKKDSDPIQTGRGRAPTIIQTQTISIYTVYI